MAVDNNQKPTPYHDVVADFITISGSAIECIIGMRDEKRPESKIRVFVNIEDEKFLYGFMFEEEQHKEDISIVLSETDNLALLIDCVSASHLKGAFIDYTDGNGGCFVVNNPNVSELSPRITRPTFSNESH